jgi:hypothetical protein
MAGILLSLAMRIRRWRLTVLIGLGLTMRPGEACLEIASTLRSMSSSELAHAAWAVTPREGAV